MEKIIRFLFTPKGLLVVAIIGLIQKVYVWLQQHQTIILIGALVIVFAVVLGVYFRQRKQRFC